MRFFFILLTPTRRRRQKKVDKSTCFVVSYFLCACTFYCYRIHRKFVKMENKFFKTKMQKKNRHDWLWCEIIKNKLRKSIKIDLEVRNEVFYFKLLLIDWLNAVTKELKSVLLNNAIEYNRYLEMNACQHEIATNVVRNLFPVPYLNLFIISIFSSMNENCQKAKNTLDYCNNINKQKN